MSELILSVLFVVVAWLLIPRMTLFRGATVRTIVFQLLFLVKILAAIGLYLIYTYYYPDRPYADIFRYYDDSAVISASFSQHPLHYFKMLTGIDAGNPALSVYYDSMRNWYNTDLALNDSRTMIRICAFLRIFTFGTYFPIAVILCFLAMAGMTGLYRSFDRILPGRETWLLIGVYLLPSTLLWTSGVIKEAVLVFASGLFFYQFVLLYDEKKWTLKRLIFILSLAFCLFFIKSYFMFLLLPGIVSFLVFTGKKFAARKTVLLHIAYYVMVLFVLPPLITGQSLPELLAAKQEEFVKVGVLEHAKSMIPIPKLDNHYSTLFLHAGSALWRTLTRPNLFDAHNPFAILAAIENLFLNFFLLICLFGISSGIRQRWKSLHWSALFLVMALGVLIGLITPILGALVRYKVPILPFLIFIALALPSKKWINYHPSWLLR